MLFHLLNLNQLAYLNGYLESLNTICLDDRTAQLTTYDITLVLRTQERIDAHCELSAPSRFVNKDPTDCNFWLHLDLNPMYTVDAVIHKNLCSYATWVAMSREEVDKYVRLLLS